MPPISFANRVFLVVLLLVIGVGTSAMYASLTSLRQDAIENSTEDLRLGQLVLGQLMTTRQQQLATSVGVLARDFGFLDAAATGDAVTIGSALANHGRRIGAQLATYIDADSAIVASSHDFGDTKLFPFPDLLTETAAPSTAVVEVGANAYQLVVVPVLAPQQIGWVGIGFEVDDTLAATLKELTRLEVSFLSPAGGHRVLASTLPSAHREGLTAGLDGGTLVGAPTRLAVLGSTYLSIAMPLGRDPTSVTTLLQRSLDEALAGYVELFEQLIIIFAVALLAAIPVARLVSNSVTRPVTVLGRAAERIERGRYDERIDENRGDELGRLAKAFNDMQRGIAERESKILYQSLHDELTGLPNRMSIRRTLQARLATEGAAGAVLVIDINGFKSINDAFGHRVGDAVLVRLGGLLSELAGAEGDVARYGSNSFIIVAAGGSAEAIARSIGSALGTPLRIDEARVRIETTTGISLFPAQGSAAEDLLRRAEIAMYGARERGEPVGRYRAGEDETHLRKLMVSHELAQALDRDELTVSFQPKLDLESGDCRHAEALVRWSHPTLGTVSPAEFVPLAEHSGLMDQLTRQVLGKTVRQLAAWNRDGLRIKVSINVSAVDLLGGDLAGDLDRILHSHGVDAAQICLEITETAVMGHDAATQPVLEALDAIGVELAIDDFGTGYSSLAQLKRLPVAELKIDRAFLSGVPEDAEDTIIVRSVIELAHNMNLRVVAEGVETAACCRWLAATGCEMAQGYAIGRPMPAAEFATWVREFDPTRLFPTGETDSDVQISNSAIV